MNFVSSGISLGAWSGAAAGIGAAFLYPNMSFIRAAAIGGGAVTTGVATLGVSLFVGMISSDDLRQGRPGSLESFLKNWTWVSIVSLAAVPYLAEVAPSTGIGLVALGIIGMGVKALTVGVLPDK